MSIYRASLKATRMQAVLDDIDNNASPAKLQIWDAGYVTKLAEVTLDKPSFTRAGAILTMVVPKSDPSANATGTAAAARIVDGAGTTIVDNLTVGTSGANVILGSVSLTILQVFTITAGSIIHA